MAALRLMVALLAAGGVWGQTNALLVDHSGSMKPFYSSGLIPDLAQKALDSFPGSAPTKIYAFGTTIERVPSVAALNGATWGDRTYIDRALRRAVEDRDAIAWVITDNIEDRKEDPDAGNTREFYGILRGDAVRKVVVCPFPLAAGTTGVVVYALLLSDQAADVFEQEVHRFLSLRFGERQVEGLVMKPLDKETVTVMLRNPAGAPAKTTFQEADVVAGKVLLTFQSRFKHLRIVDGAVRATPTAASFRPDSLLTPEPRKPEIRPEKLPRLEPGGETPEVYEVTVDMGPVRLKPGLVTLFRAAMRSKPEEIEVQVPLRIEVPPSHFEFKETFLKLYGADRMEEAKASGRVYGLRDLPVLLHPDATLIEAEVPFRFTVKYPPRAVTVVITLCIAALLLVAALVAGAVLLAKRLAGGNWAIEVTSQTRGAVPSELTGGLLVAADADLARVSGGALKPVEGVTIVDPPGESFAISEGASVTLKRGWEVLTVTFRKKAGGGEKRQKDEVELGER